MRIERRGEGRKTGGQRMKRKEDLEKKREIKSDNFNSTSRSSTSHFKADQHSNTQVESAVKYLLFKYKVDQKVTLKKGAML